MSRNFAIACVTLLLTAFIWHAFVTARLNRRAEMVLTDMEQQGVSLSLKINPVTNVVNVYVRFEQADDDPWSGLGTTMAEGIMTALGPQMIERQLAIGARENFDFYAMVIPYRVRIVTGLEAVLEGGSR
jgi:hypothetical protein